MKLTEFRALMRAQFGDYRSVSVASDHVFAELGGRTADEAIEAGLPLRKIWRAVVDAFDVPSALQHGLPDPADKHG